MVNPYALLGFFRVNPGRGREAYLDMRPGTSLRTVALCRSMGCVGGSNSTDAQYAKPGWVAAQ